MIAPTNKDMHVSEALIHALANGEGLGKIVKNINGVDHWFPYKGKKDAPDVWTVGHGHVCRTPKELEFYRKNGVTAAQAMDLLRLDVATRFENELKKYWPLITVQHEFDSIVSFSYNNGNGPMIEHDRSLSNALKTRDRKKIAASFLEYVCSGKPAIMVRGLIYRRLEEAHWYYYGQLVIARTIPKAVALLDKMIADGILNKTARYNRIRDLKWIG